MIWGIAIPCSFIRLLEIVLVYKVIPLKRPTVIYNLPIEKREDIRVHRTHRNLGRSIFIWCITLLIQKVME